MRLSDSIEASLDQVFESSRSRLQESLELRMQGVITPNARIQVFGTKSFKTRRELFAVILASWYLGDAGFLLREQVQEKILRQNMTELELSLQSKVLTLRYLADCFSERDFYGNLLPLLKRIAQKVQIFVMEPRRPRKMVRRRGYNDHGTLVPETQWKPKDDWTLDEEHRKLEERRKVEKTILAFWEGFLS